MQSIKLIPLTKGKFAVVDAHNFERLNQWKWRFSSDYAVRWAPREAGKPRALLFMHKVILGIGPDQTGDHISGDRLLNTEENLRKCVEGQNLKNRRRPKNNSSGFKGASWERESKRWRLKFVCDGKLLFNRRFKTAEAAGRKYDELAKLHYGPFARLNFPRAKSPCRRPNKPNGSLK